MSVHGGQTLLPLRMVRHAASPSEFPKTPLHLPSPPSHPTNIHEYTSPRNRAQYTTFSCLQPRPIPQPLPYTHSSLFHAHLSPSNPSPNPSSHHLTSPHLTLTLSPLLLQTPLTFLFSALLSSPPSLPHPHPLLHHHHLNHPTPHSARHNTLSTAQLPLATPIYRR